MNYNDAIFLVILETFLEAFCFLIIPVFAIFINSELMKIAKTGIIKKQNASRNVSRIAKKISSL